jgi:hypothetical protein
MYDDDGAASDDDMFGALTTLTGRAGCATFAAVPSTGAH